MRYCFLILVLFGSLSASKEPTLEEKVGQLLIVHFMGETANTESLKMLQEAHVGGFIYFTWANGLESARQVHHLSQSLQKQNNSSGHSIPLFIAIDHEGGRIHRLKEGFTHFPSAAALGSLNNPDYAEKTAFFMGKELHRAGININFAPVVDINNNPGNIVIGDRSYGNNPFLVASYGQRALKGYERSKTIAVLKHFPGHGDVSVDSHHSTPLISKSLNELSQTELYPFKQLQDKTPAILTAHLVVSSLDPKMPATLSKPILTQLLRDQWHYEGLIISDSLVMKGLLNYASSVEDAALKALQAGCDVLCLGGKLLKEPSKDEITPEQVVAIHHFLVAAVKRGDLSEEQVNASYDRVQRIKTQYQLNEWPSVPFNEKIPAEHENLKRELELILAATPLLNSEAIKKIGQAVYKNECRCKPDNLTFWNPKEEFISLGIGHFIWYPEGVAPQFEEGFPLYIDYVMQHELPMPSWIASESDCPWKTRDEFMKDFQSEQVQELREWLSATTDTQASFIINRALTSLGAIIAAAPENKRDAMMAKLLQLLQTPEGLLAVVDYLNFKGSGLNPAERYQGEGWGLFQVLENMPSQDTAAALKNFQQTAVQLLTKRVAHAPIARREDQWLEGWKQRISTYQN